MTAQSIVVALVAAGIPSVTVADVAVLARALKEQKAAAALSDQEIDCLLFGIPGAVIQETTAL